MLDRDLENRIKEFMAGRLADGVSLSDVQGEVNEKFSLKLTYMDIRIIASTIEFKWDKDEEKPEEQKPADETAPDGATDAPVEPAADQPAGNAVRGNTVVEVSKIARPGVAVCGTVKFGNGATADWYVDQTGRLGIDNLVGEQPGQEDVRDFQMELQKIFQRG